LDATVKSTLDPEVTHLRVEIDAIDATIVELVLRRAQISREIQRSRMSAGGVRVDLARERKIVSFYRSRLGSIGAHLATRILLHCRGLVNADSTDSEDSGREA
jgi:chorismate mutase